MRRVELSFNENSLLIDSLSDFGDAIKKPTENINNQKNIKGKLHGVILIN